MCVCVCVPGIHHIMGTKCPHKYSNTKLLYYYKTVTIKREMRSGSRLDLWQKLMSANHFWPSDKKRNDSDNITYHSKAPLKERKQRYVQVVHQASFSALNL